MLVILGGSVLLIPGIIFAVWFVFTSPIVILERMTYTRAMRRSRQLVKGHWWRIFLTLLVFSALIVVLPFILDTILLKEILLPLLKLGPGQTAHHLIYAITAVVFYYPLQFIFLVLLYYDSRVRKEAYNIAALREAL